MKNLSELKPNTFIFEQKNALPGFLCDDMVARFEHNHQDQYAGRIGQTMDSDSGVKKTTDLVVSGSDKSHWKDVDNNLHRSLGLALREFREAYPYFNGPFKDMGYNLQRYQPGEYYHWHIDGGSHQFAHRQLVALWYLNDVPVEAGGSTDFLFQDIRVQPEKGKLILFPPFWTHEHRAAELKSGVKYIATTWVIFA
uniref:2OG-Fe(II) oxygenase n=1 Tax=uncultured Thiotrichaceae bacterium TaxID=298394 RepID=A0A6S6TNM1_9GAMM|nr:MAG: 2OG-Fe(II) oxygenase [uncultured Thiotrichaceae bacterium]